MPNTKDVRVGAPDQKTPGAIKHAPLGTTLPSLSDISTSGVTLDSAFTGDEYVSEDGLTLSQGKTILFPANFIACSPLLLRNIRYLPITGGLGVS